MNLNLNLKDFLKYLKRFKWIIILIPILCLVGTYFLVKELPREYKSAALVSTGLTSQFQQAATDGQNMDFFKLSQQFGNLLEMMKSKRVINNLSYKLLLHDLKNPEEKFKEYSSDIKKLTDQQRQEAIAEYENRMLSSSLLSIADNGKLQLFDIMKSSGYDEKTLLEKIEIYRSGESDLIRVGYTSANPHLSAYVVNTLAKDFITYYTDLTLTGQQKSLAALDTVLRQKEMAMLKKNAALTGSAVSAAASAASAAGAQQKSQLINQQISEAEGQRAAVVRSISSIQGAILEVNNKLAGSGGYVSQDASKDNTEILNIDNQLEIANRRYINNNFNAQDKTTIDSLQRIKNRIIASTSGKMTNNSAAIRQGLINDKIKLENDLAAAKSTLATIDNQLTALGKRPSMAIASGGAAANGAQTVLARDADIASKEYTDVQTQYEKTNMLVKAGMRLSIAEPGLPGAPEPSKNILYMAISGISSVMICVLTLLLVFMLNTTINTPQQLEEATGQKVIGSLNYIFEHDKDLRNIWKDKGQVKDYTIYRDLLRSLRFELNNQLVDDNKVLGITSLLDGEGKSFLAGSLSYAFAMMGKNVLLICDKDSSLMDLLSNRNSTESVAGAQLFESFLVKKEIQIEDRITILNRNQHSNSLLELRDANSLIAGFEILKDTFDLIIIDVDSSQDIHLVKEWLLFCDKTIAVFETGNKITDGDRAFIHYLAKHKGFLGWVLNKIKIANV